MEVVEEQHIVEQEHDRALVLEDKELEDLQQQEQEQEQANITNYISY